MEQEKEYLKLKSEIESYIPKTIEEKMNKQLILISMEEKKEVLLKRECLLNHFTTSALVFDEKKEHILLVHHNIYKTWAFIGGHADGNPNLLEGAIKEVKEETGLEDVRPYQKEIAAIDILTTSAHYKNGKYVPSHLHFNVMYILQGNIKNEIRKKPDENSDVKWIEIEEMEKYIKEPEMIQLMKKVIQQVK